MAERCNNRKVSNPSNGERLPTCWQSNQCTVGRPTTRTELRKYSKRTRLPAILRRPTVTKQPQPQRVARCDERRPELEVGRVGSLLDHTYAQQAPVPNMSITVDDSDEFIDVETISEDDMVEVLQKLPQRAEPAPAPPVSPRLQIHEVYDIRMFNEEIIDLVSSSEDEVVETIEMNISETVRIAKLLAMQKENPKAVQLPTAKDTQLSIVKKAQLPLAKPPQLPITKQTQPPIARQAPSDVDEDEDESVSVARLITIKNIRMVTEPAAAMEHNAQANVNFAVKLRGKKSPITYHFNVVRDNAPSGSENAEDMNSSERVMVEFGGALEFQDLPEITCEVIGLITLECTEHKSTALDGYLWFNPNGINLPSSVEVILYFSDDVPTPETAITGLFKFSD